jgi:glycosyltransferase involved in cell wall biosynthesis
MAMLNFSRELRGTPDLSRIESQSPPDVSVVIPFFNEEENVTPLLDELYGELKSLGRPFEVIAVDDGSSDGTFARLQAFAAHERTLRCIRFRRNFGQTAAMAAGIEGARGAVIVPMDGDLQNDPADIARLLCTLDGLPVPDGGSASPPTTGPALHRYDVVSGWRQERKDKEFGRKLPSQLANWLISAISGVSLHDYGCSLKAYRREVLQDVKLYGEMHRFIPIYASWHGARVTELVVNHRTRHTGHSKYGLNRTGKVVLDLLVVKFLVSYTTKPIYLFGGFGLLSLLASFVAFVASILFKLFGGKDLVQTPLPLLGVLFALVGILSLLMGLLAELLVRTYYESQGKRPYVIAEEVNRPESRRGVSMGALSPNPRAEGSSMGAAPPPSRAEGSLD